MTADIRALAEFELRDCYGPVDACHERRHHIARFALAVLDALESRDAQHREDWGTPSRIVKELREEIASKLKVKP